MLRVIVDKGRCAERSNIGEVCSYRPAGVLQHVDVCTLSFEIPSNWGAPLSIPTFVPGLPNARDRGRNTLSSSPPPIRHVLPTELCRLCVAVDKLPGGLARQGRAGSGIRKEASVFTPIDRPFGCAGGWLCMGDTPSHWSLGILGLIQTINIRQAVALDW